MPASFQAYDHKLRFNMSYDQVVLKYRHSVTNMLTCVIAHKNGLFLCTLACLSFC